MMFYYALALGAVLGFFLFALIASAGKRSLAERQMTSELIEEDNHVL